MNLRIKHHHELALEEARDSWKSKSPKKRKLGVVIVRLANGRFLGVANVWIWGWQMSDLWGWQMSDLWGWPMSAWQMSQPQSKNTQNVTNRRFSLLTEGVPTDLLDVQILHINAPPHYAISNDYWLWQYLKVTGLKLAERIIDLELDVIGKMQPMGGGKVLKRIIPFSCFLLEI